MAVTLIGRGVTAFFMLPTRYFISVNIYFCSIAISLLWCKLLACSVPSWLEDRIRRVLLIWSNTTREASWSDMMCALCNVCKMQCIILFNMTFYFCPVLGHIYFYQKSCNLQQHPNRAFCIQYQTYTA